MFVINVRRWYKVGTSNTYHSVEVFQVKLDKNLNMYHEVVGVDRFSFGGGDVYLNTTLEILQAVGIRPRTEEWLQSGIKKDTYDFMIDRRTYPDQYLFFVTDVTRRRDL